MCLTRADADEIIRAKDKAGIKVMVGYMRRFAPAFRRAVEEVKKLERINYVRIRDIIGQNQLIIEQSSVVHRFDDIPEAVERDKAERAQRLVSEAIGQVPQDLRTAYRLLCGLSSHDRSEERRV